MREKPDISPALSGWHQRPRRGTWDGRSHAMTVDVEDYFQVEAFARQIPVSEWDSRESRIEQNLERILTLFATAGAKATFFTLGWIAERYPDLVRAIVREGHELASHGHMHKRADRQSRTQFRADIVRAKRTLEDIAGVAVQGYRAPCFSVGASNLWAFDELRDAGYAYSSSTHPIAHDNYGMPDAPRFAFYPLSGCDFVEVPVTTFRGLGRNWPCAGGGFFRLLPYALSSRALMSASLRASQPAVFYFHPWEIDPDQPRIEGLPFKSRFRHYLNLSKMVPRLTMLLETGQWARMDTLFLNGSEGRTPLERAA